MANQSSFINKMFGRYNLIVQIAKGTSSDAYLALPVNDFEHRVVIKVLKSVHLASPQECNRFLQEAQALTQLKHPYLLPIIDVGVEKGIPYVVTEYASHGSLCDRLEHKFLPGPSRQEALRILSQIGQALSYLHEHNILHGNIKLENILFNEKDEALLADFGLVALLKTVGTQLRARDPFYQAPEQSKGIISNTSDQYALGRIAYKLFSRPASLMDLTLSKICLKRPIFFAADLPQHVQSAILRAIAKNPGKRHTDIFTFMNALNNVFLPARVLPHEELTEASMAVPATIGAGAYNPTNDGIAFVSAKFEAIDKNSAQGYTQKKRLPAPVKQVSLALTTLIVMAVTLAFLVPFNPLLAALNLRPLGRATMVPQKTTIAHVSTATPGQTTPQPTPTLQSTPTPQTTPTLQPTPTQAPTQPPIQPLLQGGISPSLLNEDLTTEGTFYWAHWGLHSPVDLNQKLGVSEALNFSVVGNSAIQNFFNNSTACSWSNGTPTQAQTNTTTGVFVNGEMNGFIMTLPASTTERFLRVYVGVVRAQGRFTASLNGSNLVYTDASLDNTTGMSTRVYTVAYRGAYEGQPLTITFTLIDSHATDGSVRWQAITIQ